MHLPRQVILIEHLLDMVVPAVKVNDKVDRMGWLKLLWYEDSDGGIVVVRIPGVESVLVLIAVVAAAVGKRGALKRHERQIPIKRGFPDRRLKANSGNKNR